MIQKDSLFSLYLYFIMLFDNSENIERFLGGTLSFNWNEVACLGRIDQIEYINIAPGAVRVQLRDVQQLLLKKTLASRLILTISCFFSEVTSCPRELIIASAVPELVDYDSFGPVYSFRCKEC